MKIVLIDDDKLIYTSWKFAAKKHAGLEVVWFESVEFFLEEHKSFTRNVPIFIDSSLGNNRRGEVESQKIYDLGFLNLYLATGYTKSEIEKPHWIKDILGKRFPEDRIYDER